MVNYQWVVLRVGPQRCMVTQIDIANPQWCVTIPRPPFPSINYDPRDAQPLEFVEWVLLRMKAAVFGEFWFEYVRDTYAKKTAPMLAWPIERNKWVSEPWLTEFWERVRKEVLE